MPQSVNEFFTRLSSSNSDEIPGVTQTPGMIFMFGLSL